MPITLNPYPITRARGFTIIETLVAITILMIAIAGPLTVANQALHAAYDARNQMIASNLAQETVEEVRNYKDTRIAGAGSLSAVFSFLGTGPNAVQADSGGYYEFMSCASVGSGNCALYLSKNYGYVYQQGSGVNTPFFRSFSLTAISATEDLLTVTVSWTTGAIPNQMRIQELLSSSNR